MRLKSRSGKSTLLVAGGLIAVLFGLGSLAYIAYAQATGGGGGTTTTTSTTTCVPSTYQSCLPVSTITVAASASPSSAQVGVPITFTASAPQAASGALFQWNFGDQNAGTGSTVVHAYAAAGTYTATVSLVGLNQQGSGTVTVTITAGTVNSLPALVANVQLSASQQPVNSAYVTVTGGPTGTTVAPQTTGPAGFVVFYVPAGTYTVTGSASGQGLSANSVTVVVPASGAEVTIPLLYNCGRTTGICPQSAVGFLGLVTGGAVPLIAEAILDLAFIGAGFVMVYKGEK